MSALESSSSAGGAADATPAQELYSKEPSDFPVGRFQVPDGTVAYRFIRVTGTIDCHPVKQLDEHGNGATFSIDVHTSAGVELAETRTYRLSNTPRGDSAAAGKSTEAGQSPEDAQRQQQQQQNGKLFLDDTQFGTLRRTHVDTITFDRVEDAITVAAAWKGKWLGFNINVPLAVRLERVAEVAGAGSSGAGGGEEAAAE